MDSNHRCSFTSLRQVQVTVLALVLSMLGPLSALASGAADPAAANEDGDCHRAESERFVFHDDPWINLHHFLYQWARATSERQPGDRRRAVEVKELDRLAVLADGDRQAWERAVDFYRRQLIARPLTFDRDLIAQRGKLAAIACTAAGGEQVDAELWEVLSPVMSVYLRQWWREHHAGNAAWIRELLELLKRYETPFAERLAAAYGGEWPAQRVRVDVTAYANWAGAYSTNRPNHVTMSSLAYEGLGSLEMLFHETSHATFFEQRIFGQLAAAFRPHEAEAPDRLPHVIQFVTPAEILRSLLSEEQRGGFHSIAEAVAQRSRWRDQYEVVLEYWKPFLDGRVERAEALDRIAAKLAEAR